MRGSREFSLRCAVMRSSVANSASPKPGRRSRAVERLRRLEHELIVRTLELRSEQRIDLDASLDRDRARSCRRRSNQPRTARRSPRRERCPTDPARAFRVSSCRRAHRPHAPRTCGPAIQGARPIAATDARAESGATRASETMACAPRCQLPRAPVRGVAPTRKLSHERSESRDDRRAFDSHGAARASIAVSATCAFASREAAIERRAARSRGVARMPANGFDSHARRRITERGVHESRARGVVERSRDRSERDDLTTHLRVGIAEVAEESRANGACRCLVDRR